MAFAFISEQNRLAQPNLNYVWDAGSMSWVKETQPGGSGGGAVTIADGADVAEGSTTDAAWVAGNGTVISLLKAIAGSGGSAVSIADGSDVAEGATTDAAVITDTSGTVSGKLRGLVKWAFERMPASLGQKVMAASFPVVIASDQSAVPASQSGTWNTRVQDNLGNGITSTNVPIIGRSLNVLVAQAPTTTVQGFTTEDTASANGDRGFPALAVRTATPANTSDTDGDYEFLQMSVGRLWTSTKVDTALPSGTNTIGGTYITDYLTGTTQASVLLGSDQPVNSAHHSLAVALHPSSPLPAGTNVLGTVTIQDGGGSITVDDGGGSITVDNPTVFVTRGDTSVAVRGQTALAEMTFAEPVYSTDAILEPLSIDQSGRLRVNLGEPSVWDSDFSMSSVPWSYQNRSSQFDVGNSIVDVGVWGN
jgi:hypothetical protein